MVLAFKAGVIAMVAPLVLAAQIDVTGVSTSATQAVLQYTSPVEAACSLRVADMDRAITIASGVQAAGQVTILTSAPHGMLAGAVVYIENSDVAAWDGWQTITAVPSSTSFVFANASTGTATVGNVGVLVDDVNPALFAGANLDSRPGNITTGTRGSGRSRTFVAGLRYAQFGSDGNRYSRALQANARHHYTLTCGSQSFDQQFQTQNIPLGNTLNDGPPVDINHPGQYAYPTVQWSNQSQALIDPVTGVRSFRATAPQGTPSLVQTFVTAIDLQSAWQNSTAPLNNYGAAAMFTGPCASGTCPLFLRADNLVISGGATYTTGGNSLDWFTVTVAQASISNAACTGDDCRIVACLTVNGQTCASGAEQTSLSGTPANYTFGTQNLMDLWQGSGSPGVSRVDASQATGTVNYVSVTRQATVASGNPFNVRWTAGSTITIAGGQYTIASVQSELQLTLASGPNSNLSGVPYSANNFGVLIWKKTATADRISIGYTTYRYGSTPNASWGAAAGNPCSPTVTVAGKQGYNCFVANELYWLAADGSDLRDLGAVAFTYGGAAQGNGSCGGSGSNYQFDPQDGNTWYCLSVVNYDYTWLSIFKAHYNGAQSRFTPGQILPDCSLNHNVQPCLQFTNMQPNKSASIIQAAPLFNPDYAASGFQASYWNFAGVSGDGDLAISASGPSQDTPNWMFIYTLGDRTPLGAGANSLQLVAGASSYRKAPMSWCSIHDTVPPDSGWFEILSNNLTIDGPSGTYNMTLTSAPLNQSVGVAGGLNTCPANPFGVTGQQCTVITVNGEPASALNGSVLQNVQVGDLLGLDNEYMRVLAIAGPTQVTVQRGYTTAVASHSNTTFFMACGTWGVGGGAYGLWNYRSDPYGTNANWTTIVNDNNGLGGHTFIGGGVPTPQATVAAGGATYNMGQTLCPSSQGGVCEQVRLGYMSTVLQSSVSAVSIDPPFAGKVGIGQPNQVDTHPGLCANGWCMDGRPMNGGTTLTVSSPSQPFVNITGQLWKVSGAQSILNRKFLPTMAYVGRTPLVDVSGPTSLLGSGPQNSYEYCYAFAAGECEPGSAAGDVYVNAPYVSYPYCNSAGIGNQADDTNAICLGDLGAYTGNLTQMDYTQHDVTGAGFRRMGPVYSRWNQQSVYWNADITPSGTLMASNVRWLEGVRDDDMVTVLPPYPAMDGVSRNSFLPVPVTIHPPAGLQVQKAIVEFGYAENGAPGSYHCTSRQETCVAAGSAINPATPFYFQQSESYAGVPCATGCTVTVPALPQRVLYYRWIYLGSSGKILGSSQTQVAVTP